MKSAVVIGASGFIGSECIRALTGAGWTPRPQPAPRLRTSGRSLDVLESEAQGQTEMIDRLACSFADCDVVVNAAGLATPAARDSGELFGANALLPAVVAIAAAQCDVRRYVHISSVAVQGTMNPLDESELHRPFSPYSASKALGERLVNRLGDQGAVILRPTSVHGSGRQVTRSLVRLASSPLSSTAGRGDQPTPQVLVQNVGAAVAFLASWNGVAPMPRILLQPTEGLTSAEFLVRLGGRDPLHIPLRLARVATCILSRTTQLIGRGESVTRRLEMLWFGQGQVPGWLRDVGFSPPFGPETWESMVREVRAL